MKHLRLFAVAVLVLSGAIAGASPNLPASKQTQLGLYMDSKETADFLARTPSAVMIDVRTPEEIDESGLAEGVDALIPLAIAKPQGGAMFNPDFIPGFMKLAAEQGLAPDHPIVIICRSGNRSAQAADLISRLGFSQVYSVTDGYLGDRAASGQRTVNGWRNAGLPWQDRAAKSCAPASEGGSC